MPADPAFFFLVLELYYSAGVDGVIKGDILTYRIFELASTEAVVVSGYLHRTFALILLGVEYSRGNSRVSLPETSFSIFSSFIS